jgi:PPOX class probable F420-dependent enzyme
MNADDATDAMVAEDMRRRVKRAKVARLATVGHGGKPHVVPITFAMGDAALYFAVDHKPKKTADLQRLRNIAANPAVSVLVDHYEDDWTRLWWVRIDGSARILGDGAEFDQAIALLTERYAHYRSARPGGPVVAIDVLRMTGWSAS